VFLILAAAAGAMLGGCATTSLGSIGDDAAAAVAREHVEDRRGRFREIFCAVLEARASTAPDARPCEAALTRVGGEPGGTGRPVELGRAHRRLVAAIVPGIGWDCFSKWLDMKGTTATHLRRFGFDAAILTVDALSSCATNARQIRDAVLAMEPEGTEPELVLVGYSKGAPDILEAVVSYPEIRPRIAAVVSVAGAIGGSPVAAEVTQSKLDLLKHWPGSECPPGDGGGISSLLPATRRRWLADHPLPEGLRYYSVATCPEHGRISAALKPTYRKLRKVSPRNDGMVPSDDQLIPGSGFLGCVNADHWAVAVPIARSHPALGATLVDENDYPREALLEAVLRFVEEDLGPTTE